MPLTGKSGRRSLVAVLLPARLLRHGAQSCAMDGGSVGGQAWPQLASEAASFSFLRLFLIFLDFKSGALLLTSTGGGRRG